MPSQDEVELVANRCIMPFSNLPKRLYSSPPTAISRQLEGRQLEGQQLKGWDRIMAAADSKEEHLGILLDVLNEYYKNRKLEEDEQVRLRSLGNPALLGTWWASRQRHQTRRALHQAFRSM